MPDHNDRFEQEVMRSLGSIEATVNGLAQRAEDDRQYVYTVSQRVGVLEHDKSRRKGVTAVVSAVVSAVVAVAVAVIKAVWSG